MSTTDTKFFGTEENKAIIRAFIASLRAAIHAEPTSPDVIPHLITFFNILVSNTDAFDQYCSVNIEWIGNNLIEQLTEYTAAKPSAQPEKLVSIFSSAYRFLCELEFTQPEDMSFELRGIKQFVNNNLESFSNLDRQQIVYANYTMPSHIMKKLINNPAIIEFKKFSDATKKASELKEAWDKEIEAKEKELIALRENLSRIATTYNFVGLVNGFENMAKIKKSERLRTFISLIFFGILMISPVCLQIAFTVTHIESIESHKLTLAYTLPPLIALEVFLVYFFRVFLSNFKSLSTQLLQINLRISLCQFIESYTEYSTKIKSKDVTALEKFEAIIFSGITSDNEALPSTFDGTEQLAKLIKSFRNN